MSRITSTPQPGGSLIPSQMNQNAQMASLPPVSESLFEYRQKLLSILNKFSDAHTLKTGIEELKRFMMNDITDTDRMNVFLNSLADHNEHMKPQQKKEYIKIYGVAAEIFEESLIQFLPKILSNLSKKIKEETTQMHSAVSETLGQLVLHIIDKVEDYQEKKELLQTFIKLPLQLLEKSPNKGVQTGASQSLSKVIQNSPEEVLTELLEELVDKIIVIVNLNQFKAHTPLLECVISLIFHVEGEFAPYTSKFLPVLLEFIACNDWSTKKVAIDAIYSMTAILKDEIIPFRIDILQVLNHCRFDKIKPVRDATLETIKLLKEIGPPLDEDQLAYIEGKSTNASKSKGKANPNANNNARCGSTSARSGQVMKKSFTEGSLSDECLTVGGANAGNQKQSAHQLANQKQTQNSKKAKQGSTITKKPINILNKNFDAMSNNSFITRDNNNDSSDQDAAQNQFEGTRGKGGAGNNGKKVSAATLKRRAAAASAQSPLRESQHTNVTQFEDATNQKGGSPTKKEFKSIFKTQKNPNFFQDSQDIEIFEGKKPQNYTEIVPVQVNSSASQVLHSENQQERLNSESSSNENQGISISKGQKGNNNNNKKVTTRAERVVAGEDQTSNKRKGEVGSSKDNFNKSPDTINISTAAAALSQKKAAVSRFQKPKVIKKNKQQDAFDNIQIFEPKNVTITPAFSQKKQSLESLSKEQQQEDYQEQCDNQQKEGDDFELEERKQEQLHEMSFNNQQQNINLNEESFKVSNKKQQPQSSSQLDEYQQRSDEKKINSNSNNTYCHTTQNTQENEMIYSYKDSQKDIENQDFSLRRNSYQNQSKLSQYDKENQLYQNSRGGGLGLERRQSSFYENNNNNSNNNIQGGAQDQLNNYEANLMIRTSQDYQCSPTKTNFKSQLSQQINANPGGVLYQDNSVTSSYAYQQQQLSHKKQPQSFDEQTSQKYLQAQYSQYDNNNKQRTSQYCTLGGGSGGNLTPKSLQQQQQNIISSVQQSNVVGNGSGNTPSQSQSQIAQQLNKLEQMNLSLVMLQLEKINQQQKQMSETIQMLQDGMRSELSQIKSKVNDIENQVLDLKINCNSKINGEQVRDIIDKKMQLLSEYRRDADQMNKRCMEMSNQIKSNINIGLIPGQNGTGISNNGNEVNNQMIFNQMISNVQTESSNQGDHPSLSSSFFEKTSEWQKTEEDKKQNWKNMMNLIKMQNFEEAFNLALNSDDEMLLIRLLSKTGSFEFDKISLYQREEILRKSLALIEGKEFVDILLPCISEVVERYQYLWPIKLKKNISERLTQLKDDKELSEIQRCEIKRLGEKVRNLQ